MSCINSCIDKQNWLQFYSNIDQINWCKNLSELVEDVTAPKQAGSRWIKVLKQQDIKVTANRYKNVLCRYFELSVLLINTWIHEWTITIHCRVKFLTALITQEDIIKVTTNEYKDVLYRFVELPVWWTNAWMNYDKNYDLNVSLTALLHQHW